MIGKLLLRSPGRPKAAFQIIVLGHRMRLFALYPSQGRTLKTWWGCKAPIRGRRPQKFHGGYGTESGRSADGPGSSANSHELPFECPKLATIHRPIS
jgi:hypothetical protein